ADDPRRGVVAVDQQREGRAVAGHGISLVDCAADRNGRASGVQPPGLTTCRRYGSLTANLLIHSRSGTQPCTAPCSPPPCSGLRSPSRPPAPPSSPCWPAAR